MSLSWTRRLAGAGCVGHEAAPHTHSEVTVRLGDLEPFAPDQVWQSCTITGRGSGGMGREGWVTDMGVKEGPLAGGGRIGYWWG